MSVEYIFILKFNLEILPIFVKTKRIGQEKVIEENW